MDFAPDTHRVPLTRRRLLTLAGGAVAATALAPWARAAGTGTPAVTPTATPFQLAPLPYAFDALEPVIDAETMRLHHGKHHAGYVANLNAAVEQAPQLKGRTLEALLADLNAVPEGVRTAVRNHGGGHANHTLFWHCLTPGGAALEGPFAEAINATFGSFETFKESFTRTALGVFGSGWAWLVVDGGRLAITSTPNQDSPLMQGQQPLLGVDVWEHAYYLKYQNRRAEYLQNIWRVINWPFVAARWRSATL
jgi:Fe-Mn family superoxide dismutase